MKNYGSKRGAYKGSSLFRYYYTDYYGEKELFTSLLIVGNAIQYFQKQLNLYGISEFTKGDMVMGFFNEERILAMETGNYWCPKCGFKMEWEDEWEETLICPNCGHDMDSDHYGIESEEEYEALYSTKEELEARGNL